MSRLPVALALDQVSFRYPDGTAALSDITFSVRSGGRAVIAGPNGAGKSTLALLLNGLTRPSSGQVTVLGEVLGRHNERWARQVVGMVFQDPDDQVFSPTVAEDICFGPLNLGLSAAAALSAARESLVKVGLDWDSMADRPPDRLSYGQRKRVAIAGVLAMKPRVMVLDEPTANLDPLAEEALLDVLDELSREGVTLVIATHDMELAASWADTVVLLNRGRLVAAGGPETLLSPGLVAAAGLRPPRWIAPRQAEKGGQARTRPTCTSRTRRTRTS
jgi:cobalt/nickel transport system ATP-binding protein